MRHLSSEERERILDEESSRIGEHLTSLGEVQESLRRLASGKSLLVVDTTLGGKAARLMEKGMEKLREQGFGQLADLYFQKLFGSKTLETGRDIFQQFLGDHIDLKGIDIRDAAAASKLNENVSAVLFSGSPANVTDALERPGQEVLPGLTHKDVFDRAKNLYEEAARRDLPVLGVCYGHQMVSTARGGRVERMSQPRYGVNPVEPAGRYGADLLVGVFGEEAKVEGNVAVFHGDAVRATGEQSALVLRLSHDDPSVLHGLLHIREGKMSGDSHNDAERVRQLLKDQKHVALTVQGHPEYMGGGHTLMEFALKEDPDIFLKTKGNVVTTDMLALFTNFLKMHGRFKQSRDV